MTTRLNQSRSGHRGFTLVELLVVIAIIGILVGMLAVAVIPVFNRANEARIQVEMKQIELSIEQFRNDFGFYPPSWVGMTPQKLARYISRIAPNHREGNGTTGPLKAWWDAVGMNIDPDDGDDLVFWLSGLSKNAQFPLTDDGASTPNAYHDGSFERHVFFEFKNSQLEIHGNVAHYNQAEGVESPWVYIDAANYVPQAAYHVLVGGNERYENPNTFQLYCAGLDKDLGPASKQWAIQLVPGSGYGGLTSLIDKGNPAGRSASDNLCNFCDGRLELLTSGIRQSQAVQ